MSTVPSYATHIVGGELNYEYLGDNNYKVTMRLYKDCGPFIFVPFDDTASIYVYDANDVFLTEFPIPLVEVDTLTSLLVDTCQIIPPDVCIDVGFYETVINVPSIDGALTLAYIRCCRSASILNAFGLVNDTVPIPPDLMGATYTAQIPSLAIPNSNPSFDQLAPIIVCAGQDLSIDQSATDADGDDLVYSLCTPYTGGSLTQVFGDPVSDGPPFEEVQWESGYSATNMLGAEPALTIDPNTGLLQGRAPELIGQFVVGVCVQEFRNGQLLSESRRDFHFNSTDCLPEFDADYTIVDEPNLDTITPNAQFSYILDCDTDLAVQFNDLSSGGDSILWDFGDGTTSTETAPLHIFPDTGFYTISLIVGGQQACADTFSQILSVRNFETVVDFTAGDPGCYDPRTGLQFTDLTQDANEIDAWMWDFGDGSSSPEQHPVHFYDLDGNYDVVLTIIERSGCETIDSLEITVERIDTFLLPDSIALCRGDSVILPLEIAEGNSFSWSPVIGLNDPTAQQPVASPESDVIYTVLIASVNAEGDTCYQRDSITVLTAYPIPSFTVNHEPIQCDTIIELDIEIEETTLVQWSTSPEFDPVLSEEPTLEVVQSASDVTYFVQLSNEFCETTGSLSVQQSAVLVDWEDEAVCQLESVTLSAGLESHAGTDDIFWDLGAITGNESNLTIDSIAASLSGTLTASNSFCSTNIPVEVTVYELPVINAEASETTVINQAEVSLNANPGGNYLFDWSPAELLDDPDSATPLAAVDETTTFTVMASTSDGCVSLDTVTIEVIDIPCAPPDLFIPTAFSPNGDGLNDVYRIQGDVIAGIRLEIRDRSGNLVFETDETGTAWDGSFSGRALTSDVFGYLVTIRCFGGETYTKSGSITLIR